MKYASQRYWFAAAAAVSLWACASGDEATTPTLTTGQGGSGASVGPVDGDGDGYNSDEDCDDANPDVNGGEEETCDGVDNNCSGDESDATDALTWYEDKDGDGFGISGVTVEACEQPEGYAEEADDCNDDDADFYPGAPETDCADPNDYNCDGSVGFVDADLDGFAACEECNDANDEVHPGAPELCNGEDDDCNGSADAVGGEDDNDNDQSFSCEDCDDNDGDNFPGNTEQCDGQDNDCNSVADAQGGEFDVDMDLSFSCVDCDDNDPTNFPGNTELCDGKDNNCNNLADAPGGEGNNDGDPALACIDCDDNNPSNYPGNSEACDGQDNDCNGLPDAPGGEGNNDNDPALACADCNDNNPTVYPGAQEICDLLDNDCNSMTADGSQQAGYGLPCDGGDTDFCNEGFNTCVGGVWCSDTSGNNVEVCDNVDNDCNPATVDGSQQAGYGQACDGNDGDLCTEGTNSCVNGVFCSDNTGTNVEICDVIDQDCDGNISEGPCSLANATSSCGFGVCLLNSCNNEFCNFDNVTSNGCEFDLDTSPSCPVDATYIGSVSGDTNNDVITWVARGTRYFRVTVTENHSGFCNPEDLCVELELNQGGAPMDYDIYARCDSCASVTTSDSSGTSDTPGVTKFARLRWPENESLGCPTGSNSGRDIYILIDAESVNECNTYTLTVRGNVCPAGNTCSSK